MDTCTFVLENLRSMTHVLDNIMIIKYTYFQGKNAYKYWEIRENTEAVVMAIYNWMIEEIEKELDKLTATIVRFEKSSVTVYDPEHGEIQMELHLPIAIKSLDSVPVVNFVPYVNKAKSYIPSMPSISLPSSDVTTWIPPFAGK